MVLSEDNEPGSMAKTKVNQKQCHYGKQNKSKTWRGRGGGCVKFKDKLEKNKCKTVRHDSLLDDEEKTDTKRLFLRNTRESE